MLMHHFYNYYTVQEIQALYEQDVANMDFVSD